MVSQEPFLFDATLHENLIYGLTDVDDRKVWDALGWVNMQSEIQALREGLQTRVRALLGNLSGGQQQRLVIARALLRRRSIWLFDEATSALDAHNEKAITLHLIDTCKKQNAAMIMVTHRLSWLDRFDEIWFLEAGAVVARGEHRRLLEEPRYRAFCGVSV